MFSQLFLILAIYKTLVCFSVKNTFRTNPNLKHVIAIYAYEERELHETPSVITQASISCQLHSRMVYQNCDTLTHMFSIILFIYQN